MFLEMYENILFLFDSREEFIVIAQNINDMISIEFYKISYHLTMNQDIEEITT